MLIPTQHLPLQHSTPTLKRRTINSESAENYSMALSKATSNKRKTIQRSGKLIFLLDLNDIQHEIVVSDDSESENTGNSDMPLYSGSTPDHTYHKFWVSPSNLIIDNASSCTDTENTSVQTDTTSARVYSSISTGVQVDTFEGHTTNLTNIQLKQHQKLFTELNSKV